MAILHDARAKRHAKTRSSVANELFQGNVRQSKEPGKRRMSRPMDSRLPRPGGSSIARISTQYLARTPRIQREPHAQDEDQVRELHVAPRSPRHSTVFAVDEDEPEESVSEGDESDESENEEDWMDGSTLIAKFQEEDSETEDDRAVALVEYLQVPMQEKSQDIKQELCDLLIDTITGIRRTQQKLERGADVDRGKGIIAFNDACDKRHIDTSRARAELKDSMADNQAEINKLFVQLKLAYERRSQLWVDLRLRIDEITKLQATVIDQLDDNMVRTVAALEKKGKALLKEDSGKDKEKLLRGVLGKL